MSKPPETKDANRHPRDVNWNSHFDDLEVEVFKQVVSQKPNTLRRLPGSKMFEKIPGGMKCTLIRADGSTEDVPMKTTTIEAMAQSGPRKEYWQKEREQQLLDIANLQGQLSLPHSEARSREIKKDLEGFMLGRVWVDPDGYHIGPGSIMRGVVTKAPPEKAHLIGQRVMKYGKVELVCGCVVNQFRLFDDGDDELSHEQIISFCPEHEAEFVR